MRLLIVRQDELQRSLAAVRRAIAAGEVDRWLYVGEDAGWRIRIERTLLPGLDRVALGARLESYSEELRRPYIDWVGELSELNESLVWWGSELAAKNPYTWHYARVCALAAAGAALGDSSGQGTLAVCSTAALELEMRDHARRLGIGPVELIRQRSVRRPIAAYARPAAQRSLRAWSEIAPVGVRTLPARLSSRVARALDSTPGHRRRTLAELGAKRIGRFSGPGTVLLVSWVDERSFAPDGSYRDPHMGPLAGLLRARGLEVALLARVLPTAPFKATVQRLLRTGQHLLFPEQWVSAEEWRACMRQARTFAPRIPSAANVSGVPVERLAREHVEEFRREHAEALTLEPVVHNLTAAGVKPERVIIPFEGHAWEQVLTAAVRAHMPGTTVIGRDNLANSRLILGLFPARSELGRRPLPDRVVTNGPAFRDVLISEGLPPEAVTAGCALRHAALWDTPRPAPTQRGAGPLRVLVAGSIDVPQTIELVDAAMGAFGGEDAYAIDVKCHPAMDARRMRAEIAGLDEEPNLRFVETPIPELLGRADLVLYNYTVVGYEALAYGVPPVFVHAETFLDLDKLEPFPDVHWSARTPEQLRRVASEIAALVGEERAAWRRRALDAVRQALAPIDEACIDAFLA